MRRTIVPTTPAATPMPMAVVGESVGGLGEDVVWGNAVAVYASHDRWVNVDVGAVLLRYEVDNVNAMAVDIGDERAELCGADSEVRTKISRGYRAGVDSDQL